MNNEEIIEKYDPIVQQDPGTPEFARLGDAYLKQGNLRKALTILTEGVKANPKYVTGQQLLARTLEKAGYLPQAKDRYNIVLRIDPSNSAALWGIAQIEFKHGNTEAGMDYLRRLLVIDPANQMIQVELDKRQKKPAAGPETPTARPEETAPTEPAGAIPQEIPTEAPPPSEAETTPSTSSELDRLLAMDISKGGAEIGAQPIETQEEDIEELFEMDVTAMEQVAPQEEQADEPLMELEPAPAEPVEDIPTVELESPSLDEISAEPQEQPSQDEAVPFVETTEPAPAEEPEPAVEPFDEELPSFQAPSQAKTQAQAASDTTPTAEPTSMRLPSFAPGSEPPPQPKTPPVEEQPSIEIEQPVSELEIPAPESTVEEPPIQEPEPQAEEQKPEEAQAEEPQPEESTENLIPLEGLEPTTEPFKEKPAEELITFDSKSTDEDLLEIKPIEGLENRREFKPLDDALEETLEIEGLTTQKEFAPPPKQSGGPELGIVTFDDGTEAEVSAEQPEEEQPSDVEALSEDEEEAEIPTVTMAEIYAGQGELDKAISIYNIILENTEEPEKRERIAQRLEHLKEIRESQE